MRFYDNFSPSIIEPDKPSVIGIQIPGRYGKIYSTYYIAKGNQLNPTLIFCHGFPGHEQLIDLAQHLRLAGYNVMTFHYSGSWGSGGPYAFRHCVRDTETVIDFIKKNAERLKADVTRLGILGHGVGGFVAGHVFAERKDLKAAVLVNTCDLGEAAALANNNSEIKERLLYEMRQGAMWLRGTTGDILYNEIIENSDSYKLSSVARHIIGRPIFTISSEQDSIVPKKAGISSFLNMLDHLQEVYQVDDANKPCHLVMATDHYQSDMRLDLFDHTYEFFNKHI